MPLFKQIYTLGTIDEDRPDHNPVLFEAYHLLHITSFNIEQGVQAAINYNKSCCNNGVFFSKLDRTYIEFSDFSQFREYNKSLKHELGSV